MDRSVVVRLKAEVAQFKSAMLDSAASARKVGEAAAEASGKVTAAEKAKAGAAAVAAREAKLSETATGRMILSAEKNERAWTTAGTAIAAGGALVTGAVYGMVKSAIEWESAWAGVTKTVDGTPKQMAEIEEGLRGLARTLPGTHTEIAAVAEAAGQLGVKSEHVVGFTKTMIALGETTNLTADEAATAIAQISNVMGTMERDGVEGVERFASALVQLGNNGASTEREIVLMSQRISAAAKLIGMSEADVLGIANAVASVGINVEAGGTAISTVLSKMSKNLALGGEDAKAWADVAGQSVEEFSTAFKEKPAEAFASFVEGLGRIKEEGGNVFQVLTDLGLSDIRVSNALLTMANAGDLLRESIAMGNEAWEQNTALMDEAEKRYATTESRMAIAKNSIKDTAITMGEVMLPVVGGLADVFADAATAVGKLPDPLLKTAGGIMAVVGPVGLMGGAFLLTFPRVLETGRALRDIGILSPRVVTGLGRIAGGLAKVGGYTTLIFGVAAGVGALVDAVTQGEAALEANALADAIQRIAEGGDISHINAQFQNFGTVGGLARVEVESLAGAFEEVNRSGPTRWIESWVEAIPGVTSSTELVEERFAQLDAQLASMVEAGNAEEVRAALARIYDEGLAKGETLDTLNARFSGTQDALLGVDQAAEDAANNGLAGAEARMNTLTGAVEQLTDAQIEWLNEVGKADGAFINLSEAMEGGEASTQEWIANLKEMVKEQQAWETNMLLLSGRVSQGMLDELARLGPEGAPYVADLVKMSDDELAELEPIFGERSKLATESYAQTLMDGAPVIAAAMGQIGEKATAEMAAKLASGELTLQQAIDEYNLEMEIGANPEPALKEINGVKVEADTSTGTLTLAGNPVPVVTTLNDVLKQIGLSTEDVTINGNPIPANYTLGELMALVRNSEEAVTIEGDNAEGRDALAALVAAVIGTNENIGVGANIDEAKRTVGNWQPPSKTGMVYYTPTMQEWHPPMKKGYVQYQSLGLLPGSAAGGSLVRGLAAGGKVPGAYPGPGVDNIVWPLAVGGQVLGQPLAGTEYVINGRDAQRTEPALDALNRGNYGLASKLLAGMAPGRWGGGPVGFLPGRAAGGSTAGELRGITETLGRGAPTAVSTTNYYDVAVTLDRDAIRTMRDLDDFVGTLQLKTRKAGG